MSKTPGKASDGEGTDIVPASANQQMMELITRMVDREEPNVQALQALLDVRDRVNAEAARDAFFADLFRCQADIPEIQEDKYNSHTDSYYASLEQILRMVRPVMARWGFAAHFGTGKSDVDGCIRVTMALMHRDGHVERSEVDMPADGKGAKGNAVMTKTHAAASGLSYGRRYLICMALNLSTGAGEDDDGNAASTEPLTAEELATLHEHIEALGESLDMPKFLEYLQTETLDDLPRNKYAKALAGLVAKAKRT